MHGFISKILMFFLFAVFANFSIAQDAEGPDSAQMAEPEVPATAHATVELVSEQLLGMLDNAKEKFEEAPEEFYADIDSVISPWLDFGVWSRAVMGKQYVSLASEKQLQDFEVVFRKSLVETYAKGLINVEDTGFEVDPPHPGDENKSSVGVTQTLYSGADKVKVIYSMKKNDEGRWQFRNVLLEGVNLGKTFSNQFKSAAEDNDRDLDKVIANWAS